MPFGIRKKKLERRIAELEAEIDDLKLNLIHDYLTGTKTRAFFSAEVGTYLKFIGEPASDQRRESFGYKNLSILFLDVDHFKNINDTLGHELGDEVLREVSYAISSSLRAEDTVARWGGEEFVVSLLGAAEGDAKQKADELREKISQLRFEKKPDLKVTVSIGVAATESGLELDELISRGDMAMYQAKKSGRNQVVSYSELEIKKS